MGSLLTATICSEDKELCDDIFKKVTSAINESEKALSNTDRESELYKLNKNRVIYASDYFKKVLSDSITLCSITEMRLDISIGKVTKLWGFNTDDPSLPSDEDIKEAVNTSGIRKITTDTESDMIAIDKDIELDFGAFGKGAACDAAYNAIANRYIPMIMSLGGTVFAYGENPKGKEWSVAIRDPYSTENAHFGVLNLDPIYPKNAVFVSTSGSYEKCFTENGQTYHHILDPDTGYPVENDLVSVTVVANSGLNADALSTFFFINGLNQETLTYIDTFDCEAVFIFKDKTYYITDGLKDSLKKVSSDYSLSDIKITDEK